MNDLDKAMTCASFLEMIILILCINPTITARIWCGNRGLGQVAYFVRRKVIAKYPVLIDRVSPCASSDWVVLHPFER